MSDETAWPKDDRRWEAEFLPRLPQLAFVQAARYGERTAIIDRGERYSYADLADLAARYASALLEDGIAPGSRVAILMDNRVEWIAAYLGVLAAGCVAVPLSTWQTSPELAYVLNRSQSVAVFVAGDAHPELLERVVEVVEGGTRAPLPNLRRIVVVGAKPGRLAGATTLATFLGAGRRHDPQDVSQLSRVWAQRRHRDLAQIMFTSGSTASPKAVQIAGSAASRMALHTGQRHGFGEHDSLFLAIPLFFVYGLNNAFLSMFTYGGSTSLQSRFEPVSAMEIIQRDRCTAYYGMGAMNLALVEHPGRKDFDLSSLRKGLLGERGPDHIQMVARELGMTEVNVSYGLTESCGNVSTSTFSEAEGTRLSAHGSPLPGVEVRVVDESGRALGTDQEGEIRVRGYNITPGYYRDRKRSALAFDENGFLRTGDLGRLRDDGALTFTSRMNNVIKTNGINVSPAEVEEALQSHPAVSQAFVTSVEEHSGGEVVGAVFSTTIGKENLVDPNELIAYVSDRLSKFKVPRILIELPAQDVPRTASGKISLPALRQILQESAQT